MLNESYIFIIRYTVLDETRKLLRLQAADLRRFLNRTEQSVSFKLREMQVLQCQLEDGFLLRQRQLSMRETLLSK